MGQPETGKPTAESLLDAVVDLFFNGLSVVSLTRRDDDDADPGDGHAPVAVNEALERLTRAGKELGVVPAASMSAGSGSVVCGYSPESVLRHAQEMQFKTNDVVVVECRDYYGPRWLRISGLSPIQLRRIRSYLVIRVLVELAVTRPGEYISCTDLIEEIEDLTRGLTNPRGEPLWPDPVPADIHAEVSRLRAAITKRGGNPNLIEGCRGHGYRLSTGSWNIRVISPEDGLDPENEE